MQLFLLGLNHKTAPVEVREQLALNSSQLSRALRAVREDAGAREAAILSTCNRAEMYVLGADDAAPRLEKFLADFHHVSPRGLSGHLYRTVGGESARHLFRVASGVDSLVLGESQILGQVKSALEAAQNSGSIGGVLDELFRRAISCGKRARAETAIGRGSLSVGAAAVELARQIFGSLAGHTILILGAGKMSELTAQHLVASGAKRVIVANRTHQRAQQLAQLFEGEYSRGEVATRAVTWDEFPEQLQHADIVISSTRAPGFVLNASEVATAMKSRRSRPLLLIDIAVPRDIDPLSHKLDNVYLYDIDDLQSVVATNRNQRGGELARVESIVESEVEAWNGWYRSLNAQPVMAALSRHAADVREREVENTLAQMPDLSQRERALIEQMGRAITGKLMHAPLRYLREAGKAGSGDVDALRRAFALEESATASTRDEENSATPAANLYQRDFEHQRVHDTREVAAPFAPSAAASTRGDGNSAESATENFALQTSTVETSAPHAASTRDEESGAPKKIASTRAHENAGEAKTFDDSNLQKTDAPPLQNFAPVDASENHALRHETEITSTRESQNGAQNDATSVFSLQQESASTRALHQRAASHNAGESDANVSAPPEIAGSESIRNAASTRDESARATTPIRESSAAKETENAAAFDAQNANSNSSNSASTRDEKDGASRIGGEDA